MRRGSHRRKSSWNWAATLNLSYQDTTESADPWFIDTPLLPAPRVDWLLESGRGRDHLVVTGILLWLDFGWFNPADPGAGGAAVPVNPVDFYVMKITKDAGQSTFQSQYQPYSPPQVPSGVTNWFTDAADESDGLDPYLWTHHMAPNVAGSAVSVVNASGSLQNFGAGNTLGVPAVGPGMGIIPYNNVRASWQPDVHIRTKRRMERGTELVLGYTGPSGLGTQCIYALQARCRILTT